MKLSEVKDLERCLEEAEQTFLKDRVYSQESEKIYAQLLTLLRSVAAQRARLEFAEDRKSHGSE